MFLKQVGLVLVIPRVLLSGVPETTVPRPGTANEQASRALPASVTIYDSCRTSWLVENS